ncbi:MAG: glycosyltransferase [Lachnospiraceae bacterium]|nr:glycosyltransferase [Lachnospiraceae bacterium]
MVSIITPVYNGSKYLPETIESVIRQTYTDWEMIIVDDGSSDDSYEIAKNYSEKDDRIKAISQENGGSAAARNNGIRKAQGRYIALLDADDLWEENFLEEQLKLMKKKDCVCVYSSYKYIDENGVFTGKEVKAPVRITYEDMCIMNYIGCLTGLYDSQKYGKIYLREELKSLRDDYAYWLDIVRLENEAYGNPKRLARYRVLPGSTTGKKTKLIKVQYKFYRDYLGLPLLISIRNLIVWGVSGIFKFIIK